MPRKSTTKPTKFFITVQVEENDKNEFETTRKKLGFKRTSDYARKLIKESNRQHRV
jgi:hypothetical protein